MEEQVTKRREFWEEIRRRTAANRSRRKPVRAEEARAEALKLLRFLNMKWLSDGRNSSQGMPELQTWVPFPSTRTRRIVEAAAAHPWMRRLQFTRQLGMVCLHQRPDAGHTRWSHSVGVAECVGQFLDALDNNSCSADDPEDESVLAIGALIHDVLQGPWGHSLEAAASLFVPQELLPLQVRPDKLLLRMELDDTKSELHDIVKECFRDVDSGRAMEKLRIILDKDSCRRKHPESYYLAELLDSLIDADRLDYLQRDAVHTHFSHDSPETWVRVIQGTGVAWLRDRENPREKKALRRLVFNAEHERTIESILTLRRNMYEDIYEHPTTIILDDMLAHALFYTMQKSRIIPALEHDRTFRAEAQAAAREVLRLTDDDLLYFILETVDLDSAAGRQAVELILDIYRGRPYKELPPRHTIRASEMQDAEVKMMQGQLELATAYSERAAELSGTRGNAALGDASYLLSADEAREIAKEVIARLRSEGSWDDYIDLLLLDFYTLRGRCIHKHGIEQELWGRLLQEPGFASLVQNCLVARYGVADAATWIDEAVPLVHISLTGHRRHTAREMREHATEAAHGTERLALYNDSLADTDTCRDEHTASNGCMYKWYTPDPAIGERFEAWSVILSGPGELIDDPVAAGMIRDAWKRYMFQDRAWMSSLWVPGVRGGY